MDQHPIPQHIASFEFKLFGNLTPRQFVTLLIPGALAVAIYFSALPVIIRLPLTVIIGLFAFFIALVPINGRPFDKWAVAFIKAILTPTQRIWIKEPKIPEFLSIVITQPAADEKIPESVTVQSRERLRAYLRSLPKTNQTPLDLREQIALERLGMDTVKTAEGNLPPAISWLPAQTSFPQAGLMATASVPAIQPLIQGEYTGKIKESLPSLEQPIPKVAAIPKIALHAKPFTLSGLEKKLKEQTIQKPFEPVELVKFPLTNLASETNYSIDQIISIQTPNRGIKFFPAVGQVRVRKLHFAPPEGFDLSKLPIRGEKRFEVSDALKKRFIFDESPPVVLPSQAQPIIQAAPQTKVQEPTQTVSKTPHPIPKPVTSLKHPKNVSFKTSKTEEILPAKISVTGQKSKDVPLPTAALNKAKIIPLTDVPNVLSGQVTDPNGTPIEKAIIIVRDQNGIPLRALKTNKLGQFLSATPLQNGTFTIEVESELANFKPQAINLEGTVLSPLEIKAQR